MNHDPMQDVVSIIHGENLGESLLFYVFERLLVLNAFKARLLVENGEIQIGRDPVDGTRESKYLWLFLIKEELNWDPYFSSTSIQISSSQRLQEYSSIGRFESLMRLMLDVQ